MPWKRCNWLLCVVLLSYLAGSQLVSGLYFKPEWCMYVQAIIRHHEKNGLQASIVSPSNLVSVLVGYVPHVEKPAGNDAESSVGADNSNCESISINSCSGSQSDLPSVILWDPVTQYPELFSEYQCAFNCSEPSCPKK